jgi:hypothetical protein
LLARDVTLRLRLRPTLLAGSSGRGGRAVHAAAAAAACGQAELVEAQQPRPGLASPAVAGGHAAGERVCQPRAPLHHGRCAPCGAGAGTTATTRWASPATAHISVSERVASATRATPPRWCTHRRRTAGQQQQQQQPSQSARHSQGTHGHTCGVRGRARRGCAGGRYQQRGRRLVPPAQRRPLLTHTRTLAQAGRQAGAARRGTIPDRTTHHCAGTSSVAKSMGSLWSLDPCTDKLHDDLCS